jgi:hypothetical protein
MLLSQYVGSEGGPPKDHAASIKGGSCDAVAIYASLLHIDSFQLVFGPEWQSCVATSGPERAAEPSSCKPSVLLAMASHKITVPLA